MANKRIIKKIHARLDAEFDFMEWLNDFHCYLVEADFENIDLRVIIQQFKRKLKRLPVKYGTVTRLGYYVSVAKGKPGLD